MRKILFSLLLLLSIIWSAPAQTLAGAMIVPCLDKNGLEVDVDYRYEIYLTKQQYNGLFTEITAEYKVENQGNEFLITLYEQGNDTPIHRYVFNPLEKEGKVTFYLQRDRFYHLRLDVEIESYLKINFQNEFTLNTASALTEVKN